MDISGSVNHMLIDWDVVQNHFGNIPFRIVNT